MMMAGNADNVIATLTRGYIHNVRYMMLAPNTV